VLDPQRFKPGNKMPGLKLGGKELTDLMTFLGSLK
jgi:hypothetical protein